MEVAGCAQLRLWHRARTVMPGREKAVARGRQSWNIWQGPHREDCPVQRVLPLSRAEPVEVARERREQVTGRERHGPFGHPVEVCTSKCSAWSGKGRSLLLPWAMMKLVETKRAQKEGRPDITAFYPGSRVNHSKNSPRLSLAEEKNLGANIVLISTSLPEGSPSHPSKRFLKYSQNSVDMPIFQC